MLIKPSEMFEMIRFSGKRIMYNNKKGMRNSLVFYLGVETKIILGKNSARIKRSESTC
jgi:hypothetical protein